MKREAFVGRERETTELSDRLVTAAQSYECRFVLVVGEAGTGKKRLLQRLASLASEQRYLVLQARLPEQEAFPYQVFCALFEDYFAQVRQQTDPFIPDFTDLAADLMLLFPTLGEMEALRAAATSEEESHSDRRTFPDRASIFEVIARTLIRIGNRRPLAILLQDIHLADSALDALQYVVRRLGPTPTLVACSALPGRMVRRHPVVRLLDSFQGDSRFDLIRLEGFLPSEHGSYVRNLLETGDLDETFLNRLYDATEGNPFVTTELIRLLLDGRLIEQAPSGRWRFAEQAVEQALPATDEILKARVAGLSRSAREILQHASILGNAFRLQDLCLFGSKLKKVKSAAVELTGAGMLEETKDGICSFTSRILRDFVYLSLSNARRKALHLLYARELERENVETPDRVYAQLAFHYALAEVHEKVVDYGMMLAMRSLDSFSIEEAIRAARLVLNSVQLQTDPTGLLEAEARTLLAASYKMARQIDECVQQVEKALPIYEKEQQDFQVLRAILMAAEAAWDARRVEETTHWVERGIPPARAGKEEWMLERLLSLGAMAANVRGDYLQAREYLQEAERACKTEQPGEEQLPVGGRLKVAVLAQPHSLCPDKIKLVEEEEIVGTIFEPLTTVDENGNVRPNLCNRWESLEGGKSFLLTLESGIRMQDGQPLSATLVRTSFENGIRRSADALPAALEAIDGIEQFLSGQREHVSGITVLSDNDLKIDLKEATPIFPVLLADMRTSVSSESPTGEGRPVGTGRFRFASSEGNRLRLTKNPDYWREKPRIDEIEFHCGLTPEDIASGLRSGQLDIGRDLRPEDLEIFLRDKDKGWQIVEVPRLNIYMVIFAMNGICGKNPLLRQALGGIVRTEDLAWAALGRFAKPAVSFLPPGILGHDPDRHRHPLLVEKARDLVSRCGLTLPIRLSACVHPVYLTKLASLTAGLLKSWKEIGVEVTFVTPDMDSFMRRQVDASGIDVSLLRWNADYPDPDNFTYGLFHSSIGRFRTHFSSPETDSWMEAARTQQDTRERELLCRKLQNYLIDEHILLPLFHDIDYRVAAPGVRQLVLGQHAPFINYAQLAKI